MPLAYTIATLGLDRNERRTVRSVLAISRHGEPTFRPFLAGAGRSPHIVIVNGDSPEAVRRWKRKERSARRKHVCAVFMSREPDKQRARYVLGRPASVILLLALLEHIVIDCHFRRSVTPSRR